MYNMLCRDRRKRTTQLSFFFSCFTSRLTHTHTHDYHIPAIFEHAHRFIIIKFVFAFLFKIKKVVHIQIKKTNKPKVKMCVFFLVSYIKKEGRRTHQHRKEKHTGHRETHTTHKNDTRVTCIAIEHFRMNIIICIYVYHKRSCAYIK